MQKNRRHVLSVVKKWVNLLIYSHSNQFTHNIDVKADVDKEVSTSIFIWIKVLSVSTVLSVILLAGLAKLQIEHVYEKATYSNTSTVPGIVAIEEIKAHLSQIKIALYRYHLSGDYPESHAELNRYILQEQSTILEYFQEYKSLASNTKDQMLLKQNYELFKEYQQNLTAISAAYASRDDKRKNNLLSLDAVDQRLMDALDHHIRLNIELGDTQRLMASEMLNDVIRYSIIFVVGLILSLLVLTYGINKRLQRLISKLQVLDHESAMFRNMIDHVEDVAVIVQESNQKVIYANTTACKHFQVGIKTLLTMSPKDLKIDATSGSNQITMDNTSTFSTSTVETVHILASGDVVPVEVTLSQFYHGNRSLYLSFIRNISSRKAMEATQAAALAETTRLIQLRNEFIAQMSHELRTPLNGILGYSQILLRETSLSEQQIKGVTIILQSGEHLLMLINDVLDFAKVESGKLELTISDLRIDELLNSIIDIINIQAKPKLLNVTLEIGKGVPEKIRGDNKRLRQVLLNLLTNAVKFTDNGQVNLRVLLLSTSRIRFEVNDTGIGISKDKVDVIFLPFEQVGDQRRKSDGSGLGLAISQQIVKLMGGEIRVESCLGQGSTFWFDLDCLIDMVDVAAEGYHRRIIGYEGIRKSVLVISEVATDSIEFIEILSPLGFEITEVNNSSDGLKRAQAMHQDLILINISTPIMSAQQVKQLSQLVQNVNDSPIIISSATDPELITGNSLHVSNFLPKSINRDEFLAQISSMLKINWTYVYEGEVTQVTQVLEMNDIQTPPQNALEELFQLALRGNMRNIIQWANELAESDKNYLSFANQVSTLAREFQSKAILTLVKRYLEVE